MNRSTLVLCSLMGLMTVSLDSALGLTLTRGDDDAALRLQIEELEGTHVWRVARLERLQELAKKSRDRSRLAELEELWNQQNSSYRDQRNALKQEFGRIAFAKTQESLGISAKKGRKLEWSLNGDDRSSMVTLNDGPFGQLKRGGSTQDSVAVDAPAGGSVKSSSKGGGESNRGKSGRAKTGAGEATLAEGGGDADLGDEETKKKKRFFTLGINSNKRKAIQESVRNAKIAEKAKEKKQAVDEARAKARRNRPNMGGSAAGNQGKKDSVRQGGAAAGRNDSVGDKKAPPGRSNKKRPGKGGGNDR